tara:strand:- start:111 stop:542 length:432 start_codon:yes stop_codon:yes gene_type:complete
MSTERNKMIESLKKIVIPELRNLNFKGSFPHFRRTENEKTNLLTFQFDRSGGGFIIELANWNKSEFKNYWDKIIPLNKLTAHDLNKRQRIHANSLTKKSGIEKWFRYDQREVLSFGNRYDNLSKKVVERIPLMEKYWNETLTE